ncbi:hypothetical protein H0H93_007445 [Arthromyces matolae]|nr:hypothetical protein H0H93_007445 [Arthromyces matolae]
MFPPTPQLAIGNTPSRTARSYQLSVANPAIDTSCSNLVPQTTICLGYSGEDCSTTYVVTADDTCDGIASNNGLNSTILYLNNPQINSDCTNIYIGEVLCVSNTVQVPPTPTGALPGATIPATATPAKATTTAASTTSAASSTSTATHAASNSASEDDDDDDDLPYCDEL